VYLDLGQRIAGMGTWAWKPSSGEMFGSQEFYHIFGIDSQSTKLSRQAFLQRIHPEDRPGYEQEISGAIARKEGWEIEYRIVLADGAVRHIRGVGRPVLDEHGEISELIGTVMDVTVRKHAEEELRRLAGRLLNLQDEERRRIASELHDTVGQDLVALATFLGQIRESIPSSGRELQELVSKSETLADHCLREVRTLSYVLYPPVLDQTGLVDAIRDYVTGFTKRTGIQVELEVSPYIALRHDIELALYRVVQESLTNIQRHSGSLQAKIRIHRNTHLTLEVSDSGPGVSGKVRRRSGKSPFELGVGIKSMQERVKFVGGRLEIETTGDGTTVRAMIPLGGELEKTSHSIS
jgi:two-component system sensor histidine kinase UhpB